MTTVLENGVHDGRLGSSPNGSADPEQLGLIPVADGFAPAAPTDLRAIGLEPGVVSHLALKTAYTVPQFTTEWAARQLHLPAHIVGEVLEQLRSDGMLEILGSSGPFGFRYAI